MNKQLTKSEVEISRKSIALSVRGVALELSYGKFEKIIKLEFLDPGRIVAL